MSTPQPLSRSAWLKTPYAGTTAANTDADVVRILNKYGVGNKYTGEYEAKDGRPVYSVRFQLKQQYYRVEVTTLSARDVTAAEKMSQAKRVAYYAIKSLMELANQFLPFDVIFLPFAEINDGDGVRVQDVATTILEMPRLAAAQNKALNPHQE